MKVRREIVEVGFVPFACRDCGNLQLVSDHARGNAAGNCPACESWNVIKGGPAQITNVKLYKHVAPVFEKGES